MNIIGASLTHNDFSKGHLAKWFSKNSDYFDKWVILDDCSDDETFDTLKGTKQFGTCKMYIHQTDRPLFKEHENKIRKILWNKVREVAKPGDWILVLDSDEIICPEFIEKSKNIVKKKGLISFKKIEMWNKKDYRIDGLWSNYFDRMFPYEDREWGYDEKGFHFPQVPSYAFTEYPRFNSDIRIIHLAYDTPEKRKAKYDFMMNNPQQDKDITYYHLQTVMDLPVLKEYKEIPEHPKILLTFICANMFELPEITRKTLENLKYPKEKVDVLFLVSGSSGRLIRQVEDMEVMCNKNDFILINYQEEFNNSIKDRKALLKKDFFEKYGEEKYKEYEHIFIIDGEHHLEEQMIYHHLLTDKELLLNRRDVKVVSLSKRMFEKLVENKRYLFLIGPTENLKIAELFNELGEYVWGAVYGPPFPLNVSTVLAKMNQE
jgi:hypothetical protein